MSEQKKEGRQSAKALKQTIVKGEEGECSGKNLKVFRGEGKWKTAWRNGTNIKQEMKKERGLIENAYVRKWRINPLRAVTQDDKIKRIQRENKRAQKPELYHESPYRTE